MTAHPKAQHSPRMAADFHGPETTRETISLIMKGVGMGCADLVPGVSGGTIALITGIYNQLLHAISSVGTGLQEMVRFRFREGLAAIQLRFLICLLSGIGLAIIGLSRVMHRLLAYYPVPTWGSFFGLIAASILIIGKPALAWRGAGFVFFVIGAVLSFLIVGMIPVSTPETLWFIFFSGMIAICAMILPGISGAFLLLILGKYQFITGALKNPLELQNIIIISTFCGGCITGVLSFSRFLSYMMDHHHARTMALLTGFMFGSMRKIWPWKETLETITIRGKIHILSTKNILPPQIDGEFYLTLALAATGFVLVLFMQRMATQE